MNKKLLIISLIINQTVVAAALKSDGFQLHDTIPIKKISNLPINSATPLEALPQVLNKMHPSTWPKGCPVPPRDLMVLHISYFGFDQKDHSGLLIVHRQVANELLHIFKHLYKNKFPIERVRPMYEYANKDELSMAANNTSAFNCRPVTGKPGVFSQHSYGIAIDINPKINPYVKGNIVLPENGRPYVSRDLPHEGKITNKTQIYHLFTAKGWTWGGNWQSLKDYQHFEKPF